MAGAGTKNTVGKVGVKTIPDTDNFRSELRAKLTKALQGFEVKIPVDLDTSKFGAAAAKMRSQLEGQTIKQSVDIDSTQLDRVARSLGRIRRPLAALGSPLNAMARSLRTAGDAAEQTARSIVNMRREIASMVGQTAVWVGQMIRHAVSVETARKAWVGLSRAVSAVGAAIRKIPSLALLARDLALAGASASKLAAVKFGHMVTSLADGATYANLFYKSMEKVAVFGMRTADAFDRLRQVRLSDVVNGVRRIGSTALNATRSIGRLGKSLSTGIGRGIDGVISGIGSAIKKGFSGAADMLSNVASSFGKIGTTGLLVGAVLAIIAPLIGLIAGLLAGLPSLIAAFGAAFAAVALGMDGIKKAAEVFGPSIDKLKKSLSDTFAQGLTPIFKQLNTVFPVLQTGLNEVAKGLIPLVQGFTNVVTSADGLRQISTILQNTGQFFAALQPMVENFTRTFLTLSEVGSSSFGILATVLNSFASSFNNMIERVSQSGVLTNALNGLAQVTGSLLGVFTRLFEAGLQAMGQLGGPLATLISGFGDLLVALMPALTALSSLVANVLGKAFAALAPVIAALTPAFELLADIVGQLLVGAIETLAPILTSLAEIVGAVLLAALQAIQPFIPQLVQFMTQLGQVVGGFLTQAFTMLQPFLEMAGQLLTELLTAIEPLLPVILQLITAGLDALIQILTPLIDPLMQLAQAVIPLLVDVINELMPVIVQIAQAFTDLIPPIADLITTLVETLMPVFQSVLDVVMTVFPYIKDIISGAMDVISGIIKTVMSIIKGDWSGAWEGIKQVVSGAWDMIKGAVEGAITAVVEFFKNVPGKILGALGDLGGLLWDAGKSIITGLLNGLKSAVGAVWDFVGGIAGRIADLKGPLPYDRRLLIPAGKAIMEGLHKGLSANFAPVLSTVSGMADRISAAFDASAVSRNWAKGIEEGTPAALRSMEALSAAASQAAAVEWQGHMESEDFGSIEDRVADALSGWSISMDRFGVARMVRSANTRNENGR